MSTHTPRELRLSSFDEANRTAKFCASTTDYVVASEEVKDAKGAKSERDVFEAVTEWDLNRFLENPVVLWSHAAKDLPIGKVTELSFDQELGLEATIKFAPEKFNPRAEQIWQGVREDFIRAVSVGFDSSVLETEIRAGVPYRKLRGFLNEISLVTVPADAKALVRERAHINASGELCESVAPTEEERLRADASAAGKALSKMRKPKSADENLPVFDSASRLDSADVVRTSFGVRVPSRFGKVGVLTYRLPGGGSRRELRPSDEVFSVDSLESLRSAPVVIDHPYHLTPPLVTPEHSARLAKGHVEKAAKSGDFVAGTLMVTDADTLAAIDSGRLTEVSPGYTRRLDYTPGVWNGQPYDAVQRHIVYNHIALLPQGKGRAGPDVALLMDGSDNDAECVMEMEIMKVIILDSAEYEFGSPQHIEKINSLHAVAIDAKDKELASTAKALDEAQATLDATKAAAESDKKTAGEEFLAKMEAAKAEKEERSAATRKSMKRALRAVRIMEVDEEDEAAMDGLLDLSERDLMVRTIQHSEPAFVADGRSDEYVTVRFDLLKEAVTDSVGNIVRAVQAAKSSTAVADPVEAARAAMAQRNRDAFKVA